MSDTTIPENFPRKYFDAMAKAAREFNPSSPPTDVRWRFDGTGISHFDTAESAFVARQLEFLRPGIYQVQYPELKAARLIPFDFSVDTGAEQYTATIVDIAGIVKVSKDLAGDTPMANMKTTEASTGIYSMRLGYQYSLQQVRNAIMAKMPLAARLAMATREQMERKLDDVAFQGDLDSNTKGLLNASGTTTYATPATGTAGSKKWDDKASDDVLIDLNGAPNQVITDTKEVEVPDTMVLPLTSKTLISNRRVGDGTSSTILRYFLDNQEYIKTVEGTFKSETLGAGTTKRGCAYRKDPSKLAMIVPQPFEQLQPMAFGFNTITLCHMRTAGVALYAPKSVVYFDAI